MKPLMQSGLQLRPKSATEASQQDRIWGLKLKEKQQEEMAAKGICCGQVDQRNFLKGSATTAALIKSQFANPASTFHGDPNQLPLKALTSPSRLGKHPRSESPPPATISVVSMPKKQCVIPPDTATLVTGSPRGAGAALQSASPTLDGKVEGTRGFVFDEAKFHQMWLARQGLGAPLAGSWALS